LLQLTLTKRVLVKHISNFVRRTIVQGLTMGALKKWGRACIGTPTR